MRSAVNDIVRWLLRTALVGLGAIFAARLVFRISGFSSYQTRLRNRYGIRRDTPLVAYGPTLARELREAHSGTRVQFAHTSATTGEPKRIPYTKRRIRELRLV